MATLCTTILLTSPDLRVRLDVFGEVSVQHGRQLVTRPSGVIRMRLLGHGHHLQPVLWPTLADFAACAVQEADALLDDRGARPVLHPRGVADDGTLLSPPGLTRVLRTPTDR